MQIISINKPVKGASLWSGTATNGDDKYEWFYEPRRFLRVRIEERPRVWMTVDDPPPGAKRAILKAIRAAKAA